MKSNLIYLDYNASTPVDPEVLEAMLPYFSDIFANPSGNNPASFDAQKAITLARKQIADFINCSPDEIIFTSGGTESNNMALSGTVNALSGKGRHIITSAIEHPSVTEVCKAINGNGYEISYLPVDRYGMCDPEDLKRTIRKDTILVSIMHSNNEVGTLQSVDEMAKIARDHGVLIHSDASQSAGKVDIDVSRSGVDMLTLAGHKFYAPKGIGILYIRSGTPVQRIMQGAGHERGLRAGTENVPGIVGLGKAAELAKGNLSAYREHMLSRKKQLKAGLAELFPAAVFNGHPQHSLPNTVSISLPGVRAVDILAIMPGLAVSPGAACHVGHDIVSHVLQAMGVPQDLAKGTIRFSIGRDTSINEISRAIIILRQAYNELN